MSAFVDKLGVGCVAGAFAAALSSVGDNIAQGRAVGLLINGFTFGVTFCSLSLLLRRRQ